MSTAGTTARQKTARGFGWQAALILLPVLALAAVGVWALRQDRLAAEQESKERAQALADEAAHRIMAAFFPQEDGNPRLVDSIPQAPIFPLPPRTSNTFVFTWRKIDRTVFPLPVNLAPRPEPLDLSLLTERQVELWRALESVPGISPQRAEAIPLAREFISTEPPRRFGALAEYRCGVMELAQVNTNAAITAFEKALTLSSNVLTEAGLPLEQLVQLHLLELWPMDKIEKVRELAEAENRARGIPPMREVWPHPWLMRAIDVQHSPVSPWLAEAGDRRALPQSLARIIPCGDQFISTQTPHQDFWRYKLRTAELAGAVRSQLESSSIKEMPRFLWFTSEGDWLAARLDIWANSTSEWWVYYCLPQPAAEGLVMKALFDMKTLPSWCSVSVMIAGRPATPDYGWHPAWNLFRGEFTPLLRGPNHWLLSASPPTNDEQSVNALLVAQAFEARTVGERPGRLKPHVRIGSGREPVMISTSQVLATAAPIALAPELQVRVHLADPAAFYARIRQRTIWFGSLIGGSTLAALVGLIASQRAFRKQQRLAEMKSNFVSSVSHELRAPIASVRLMSESLERGKITEPAKQQEYFRFIGQECRRLSALIENVLDFARIEQGRKQYEFEPTDVAALVRATVQLMEPAAREQGIKLELELDEASLAALNSPPHLDSRAIQQALVNLLDNAIKYSSLGAATVVVGTTVSDRQLQIWVEDHGCGIAPEEHERIFELFYRVGSEMRRETQGVGIGLSIVKHIVAAHGGRVLVRSVVGQGSRFTMELPLENHDGGN